MLRGIKIMLAAAMAMAAPALPGGWIEYKDGKTVINIKVFQLPEPGNTSAANQAELAAVNAFKKDFPAIFKQRYAEKYKADPDKYGHFNWDDVEIRLHQFSGIKVPNLDNVTLAIVGDMAPDVLYVNFMFINSYIENGVLYPLDKPEDGYFSAMTPGEKDFRVNPKLYPVIRQHDSGGAEHVWAMPYGGALGKVVAYRKDLFDHAGIPYPSNDWTWMDFLGICRKISDPARGIYGAQFWRGPYESCLWTTFLWSAGGEVMVYDEKNREWSCTFDSDAAAAALDFYTQICTEPWRDRNGKQQYGYIFKGEDFNKWSRGEIACQFEYIDEKLFTSINPEVTGLVPVPLGPDGRRGAELNSKMMGLFAGVKDPAVRDAAWEFMRYYESEKAVGIKTKAMVEGGLAKFINPKHLEKFGYSELVRYAPPEWAECFEIAMDCARPEPYGKGSRVAYIMMSEPIQQIETMALRGELPADRTARLAVMKQALEKAVAKANVVMLGKLTPQERFRRNCTALAVLLLIAAAGVFLLRRTYSIFAPPAGTAAGAKGFWQFRRYFWAYLILLPALATIFFWQYIPLLRGSIMAFQDFKIMGGSSFVWLDNFGDVLWSSGWWSSVFNSLRYSFLVILLTFFPPVVLAILLQETPAGSTLFRVLFYLPAVTTSLVLMLLWRSFYEESENGTLNMIVMHTPAIVFIILAAALFYVCFLYASRLWCFGKYAPAAALIAGGLLLLWIGFDFARPILFDGGPGAWYGKFFHTMPVAFRWLSDPSTAMLACVMPLAWAGIGPGCLIYLAALKGIAPDMFEQSEIDGATFTDKVLFIVFPMLKPLLIINFVGVLTGSFMSGSANIMAMTSGGAKTEVADLHIFYKAFIHGQFGPATAMAWVLGLMLIGFTVQQLQILSKLEFKTTGKK